jgi:hypothetical protein
VVIKSPRGLITRAISATVASASAAICGSLGPGQPLGRGLLQRERREQVLSHDAVLKLRRLAQDVDQRLTVLDHEWRLSRRKPASGGDHLSEPPTWLRAAFPAFAHVVRVHS